MELLKKQSYKISYSNKIKENVNILSIKKKCCCGKGLNLCKILTSNCIYRLKF